MSADQSSLMVPSVTALSSGEGTGETRSTVTLVTSNTSWEGLLVRHLERAVSYSNIISGSHRDVS